MAYQMRGKRMENVEMELKLILFKSRTSIMKRRKYHRVAEMAEKAGQKNFQNKAHLKETVY